MRLSGSGRPKALNDVHIKLFVWSVKEDPKKRNIKLSLELKEKRGKVVSDRTV